MGHGAGACISEIQPSTHEPHGVAAQGLDERRVIKKRVKNEFAFVHMLVYLVISACILPRSSGTSSTLTTNRSWQNLQETSFTEQCET